MPLEKIGVLGCAGEECFGGTISRLAVRKMLEERRPDIVCSLCLPLYLAGGSEERKFAQTHSVLSIDGCNKMCAKISTEKYSGKVDACIDVSQVIGEKEALSNVVSEADFTKEHYEMLEILVDAVCVEFDKIVERDAAGLCCADKNCGVED